MSRTSTTLALASEAPASRLSTLPEGEPEFTLGWEAILWAEGILIQPNGPRAGKPFRFTRDQMRFLLWWYALHPDGDWIYHHGVRRLAKGSGKSPFAAVLCLIEFCAPVRLDRKDHRLPGGCAGRPLELPWVQIAATAESQTKNTMRMVRAFAPKHSAVVREYNIDVGKTVYFRPAVEGTLEVITSSPTAAEGAEPALAVADETEWWTPSNGGVALMDTLDDNLAKSNSRLVETANSWVPGTECVAEGSWDAWLAQEEGRLRDEAGLVLYDARIAPPDTDITDYESLAAALRWVYGDCDWKRGPDGEIDVAPIIKRIWSPRAKVAESKRKYLNQPTVAEDAWSTPEAWTRLAKPRLVHPDEEVALFFDGSKSRDATAIVACVIEDGYVFVPRSVTAQATIWEPDPSHDADDVVSVEAVDGAMSHVFDSLNVVAFFGDVAEWESFVKIEWPKRFGDRLVIDAVDTGKDPQKIAWDMRSNKMLFTRAAELCLAEINDGLFAHDNNPALARHVANLRERPNQWGKGVGKESRSSPLKVDAGICMIGARMVRRLVLAARPEKRSGAVW